MIAYLSLGPAGSLEFEIRLCLGATQPQGQELRNWKLRLSRPDGESRPNWPFVGINLVLRNRRASIIAYLSLELRK